MPAPYLVAIVALGLTIVPLLLVVVNGFRTNADINANAAGLPNPWVAGNYTAILKSGAFWQLIGNSAIRQGPRHHHASHTQGSHGLGS